MLKELDRDRQTIWTEQRLQTWVRASLGGTRIVVLSNREPVSHERTEDGRIVATRAGSGVVAALEPLVRACSGVWVAHGAGGADRAVVDDRDGVDVESAGARYRLRRLWLDACEKDGYYYGFANEALWPLCHRAYIRPVFRSHDFATYRAVNDRFAATVCDEAEDLAPVVLVQDYHFALAPRFIRRRLPLSSIVTFWHIPWPHPHDFQICPWAEALVRGLLGSSIVGFQTSADAAHFLDTAGACLDARIDRAEGVISHEGHETRVRVYPASIEWPSRLADDAPPVEICRAAVRRRFQLGPDALLGVGIDRMDYTKGIEEKFLAVERLLDLRPELRHRFALLQVAEPSRSCLPAYRELRARLVATADRINARFGAGPTRPIVLVESHREPEEVYELLRAADLCYVGSLHDGMNLVAKEFVSARDDGRGVLVLSRYAGAARQLSGALLVNPYAIDESAHALAGALTMHPDEQARRMRRMQSTLAESSSYWWAGRMLRDAAELRRAGGGRAGGEAIGRAVVRGAPAAVK